MHCTHLQGVQASGRQVAYQPHDAELAGADLPVHLQVAKVNANICFPPLLLLLLLPLVVLVPGRAVGRRALCLQRAEHSLPMHSRTTQRCA